MENLIIDNTILIILLPLWIFLIIMCGRFFSVYVNKNIIYFLTLLSSFLGAGICGHALINYGGASEWVSPFIKINEFTIYFGLRVDKISLIVALMLFIISFSVQLFSISYMKEDKKNYKFFAFLNLFNFAMAFLLFSPNLFQFYVFWELVGVVSYLLIGFNYRNENKSQASRRVFLMNRVGDTALIAGIIVTSCIMYSNAGNYSLPALSFEEFNTISPLLLAYTGTFVFHVICGLFILAAIVKSAQFPFYTWLQDAMEAEIPVSALLHSATMVIAGVYLIIRMMPFFTLSSVLTDLILITGMLTAVVCSVLASLETNSKKILAYSTSSNLGLMFTALGLGSVKTAVILLVVHAFIKSMLFMLLPKGESISRRNFVLFIICALSLSGLILSGVGAKEILYGILQINRFASYSFMFVCFITGFYLIRLAIMVNNGLFIPPKSKSKEGFNAEFFAFMILLSGNVVLYLLIYGSYHIAEPYAAAIGGSALALLLGKNKQLDKFGTPKILEKLYNNFVPCVYHNTAQCMSYIDVKILSNYKLILFLSKLPVKIVNWIEVNIMNKSVSLISDISKGLSKRDKILQDGNVQTYNGYAFILVTVTIALVITGYTLIFG